MPALQGILETVLYVDDLERAHGFYASLFGLESVFSDQRICAFDVAGRGLLLLFRRGESLRTIQLPDGQIPAHDGQGPHHIAFAIGARDVEAWEARLAEWGITVEGRARWPRGGTSLYFRDPDGHLVELATPGLWKGY